MIIIHFKVDYYNNAINVGILYIILTEYIQTK